MTLQTQKTLLQTEKELILLKINFCLNKKSKENKSFYKLLVFYGGLNRFTQKSTKGQKESLKKEIQSFEKKILKSGLKNKDKEELAELLLINSDLFKQLKSKKKETKCFNFDIWQNEGVSIHFKNNIVPQNPLNGEELENRKKELKRIANKMKKQNSSIKYVFSISWMWNLRIFQELMPKEFNKSLKEFKDNEFYSLGHWGQFIRYDGTLNKERAREFRKNWKFPLPTLIGKCKKDAFLRMYGVKK
jgi:hypothetical protein